MVAARRSHKRVNEWVALYCTRPYIVLWINKLCYDCMQIILKEPNITMTFIKYCIRMYLVLYRSAWLYMAGVYWLKTNFYNITCGNYGYCSSTSFYMLRHFFLEYNRLMSLCLAVHNFVQILCIPRLFLRGIVTHRIFSLKNIAYI